MNSADYEVGYGKPPKHSQFKKGISGNPNGRPRKEKTFQALVEEELKTKITVNGKPMTKKQAVALSLVNEALKGKSSARQVLLSMISGEDDEPEEFDPMLADRIAMLKAMQNWENRTEEPS